MDESGQTREQLLRENQMLRRQLGRLQARDAERRRIEQALQEHRLRLRLLMEQVPALLWTTDQELILTSAVGSGFIFVNQRPEELIGHSLLDIFPATTDTPVPVAAHRSALNGEQATYEQSWEGRFFQCRVEPFRDPAGRVIGCIGIAIDMSDHLQAELALRESEERFRVLVQNSSDIIAILEPDGTIRYQSSSLERILGYHPDELIGVNAFTLIHPDDLPAVIETFDYGARQPGIILSAEYRFRHKDGSWRLLESTGSNLLDHPAVRGVVINSRDITERKQTEEERDRLYVAAQEALEVREQFLSLVRHELGTPMTVLLGYTQLLQRRLIDVIPAEYTKLLQMQAEQATRMHRLISSLLDLPSLQEGQLSLERQALDLTALARRVTDGMRPVLQWHTLVLEHEGRPLVVEGDAVRLEQVLHNLLHNAVKYSPEGGVVEVTVQQQSDMARISVRDYGIGIPELDIPRLFERFYRASNIAPGYIRGMGMGLYVVKQIVTLHGGTVEVQSEEGHGSTFTISLPLARPLFADDCRQSEHIPVQKVLGDHQERAAKRRIRR